MKTFNDINDYSFFGTSDRTLFNIVRRGGSLVLIDFLFSFFNLVMKKIKS